MGPPLLSIETLAALATLTALEIVLGIDNVVFIAILVERLPERSRAKARRAGLALALAFRILLLLFISWIAGLTRPWVSVLGKGFSGRDLLLLGGGLFLIAKSTLEIHARLEGADGEAAGGGAAKKVAFWSVIAQVIVLDVVFSLDSVITAVGLVQQLPVMIAAIVISVVVMILTSGWVSGFIHRHPTVKMLALSFLLMVGLVLFSEGFGAHVPKGYIYSAMAFSIFVEALNLRLRRKSSPVRLHDGAPGKISSAGPSSMSSARS